MMSVRVKFMVDLDMKDFFKFWPNNEGFGADISFSDTFPGTTEEQLEKKRG